MSENIFFPDYMGRPLQNGYSDEIRDQRYVFENEAGAPSLRRRKTGSIKQIQLSFIVSAANKLNFEEWFDHKTQGGVNQFKMSNPISGGYSNYQFLSMPSATPLSGKWWTISFGLLEIK